MRSEAPGNAETAETAGAAPDADGAELDFSRRAQLSEWMDEPCSYEEFRDCLRDLEQVNRVTFARRPTRIWLERLLRRHGAETPLHIVDVGAGGGDMLRFLSRWARRRGVTVRLTGLDLNPFAARAAAERTLADTPIEWITGDAFSYTPAEGFDVVISSLFTHHLPDETIPRFLHWIDRNARLGWFVNDLHRAAAPYFLFRLLAGVARWHPFVRHDGPVSIRRGFSAEDWQGYLALAGIDPEPVMIEHFRPARLCLGKIRKIR